MQQPEISIHPLIGRLRFNSVYGKRKLEFMHPINHQRKTDTCKFFQRR